MTQRTPLFDEHLQLHAKMMVFHGWEMPLQYSGILKEHEHCRNAVSLFDCSHMGVFMLSPDDMDAFDPFVFVDLPNVPPGRCRYTSILTECGGIVDDVIVCRLDPDALMLVSNAGPLKKVAALMRDRFPTVGDVSAETAKIDVQGPQSRDVLKRLGLAVAQDLRYFGVARATWEGVELVVTRAGYTGELGFELYLPNAAAPAVWRRLLDEPETAPAGLGARDTLRLEMGFTLYGQDVDENVTSLEAGMGRFIDWHSDFLAKPSLWLQREIGRYKIRTGIRSFDRRAPRPGFEVRCEGRTVGNVTSGGYGPSVGHGIGAAYLPLELSAPGVRLTAGPKNLEVETVELPFYRHGSVRG